MARRRRKGRPVDGILLLDKPAGVTSNGALQQAKRLYGAAKAGHTGSLDPLATGVLPLCFGEATKFSQFLLEADKRYLATLQLGVTTRTGDADGDVVSRREVPVLGDLESVLEGFRGTISQIPSMYSALKVDGQPLYKLARAGVEVERKSREVQIHELILVEQHQDSLVLDISCSKGTYIRTLAEDIGDLLGCGAHVSALRRLQSGPFGIEETITMAELEQRREDGFERLDEVLLPICSAVKEWPRVALTEITASYFRQGQPVQVASSPTAGWVSIFDESSVRNDASFIGVGEVLDDGKIAPRRLIAGH